MADHVLREECEHGLYDAHWEWIPDPDGGYKESCPGGQEVTIDYEAAKELLRKFPANEESSYGQPLGWGVTVEELVDAALGEV